MQVIDLWLFLLLHHFMDVTKTKVKPSISCYVVCKKMGHPERKGEAIHKLKRCIKKVVDQHEKGGPSTNCLAAC